MGVFVLTDIAIKRAKPRERQYKLADSGGLYLAVMPAGGRLWRVKYRMGGKERLLSVGPYPAVTLANARAARDRAKELLRQGRDPSTAKRLKRFEQNQQASETFETVARDWWETNRSSWSERHADDVLRSLDRDVFRDLGALPIREIKAPDVLATLRKVEARGAVETAHRIRQRIEGVYTFALASGLAEDNPAAIVGGALSKPKRGHWPAVTKLEDARKLLRDLDAIPAHPVTRLAVRLKALTVVRSFTLRTTPWTEMKAGETLWTIPAARLKMELDLKDVEVFDHLVPLSKQAVETIAALRTITGRGQLMFPGVRRSHTPMSENAIGYLQNRAGYHGRHVPHGWRTTFSTIMNERFRADRLVIDFMLAHGIKNKTEAAYNRALYLDRRAELAQIWADLLMEGLPPPVTLLDLPRR